MKRVIFLFFLPLFLFAQETWTDPWFTGPILVPSALINDKGVVTWQPYIFVTNQYGFFDQHWHRHKTPNLWSIQPLADISYGLNSFLGIETIPSFSFQTCQGSSAVRLNDTPFFLAFQALRQTWGPFFPDLRIRIFEVFPLGQYDKLNPQKNMTDATGQGSYQTGISFCFQKTFKIAVEHYFRLRWSFDWSFYPAPVHIQGLSVYGGAHDTSGRVFPGKTYNCFLSGEYTITHNWVFAFDIQYLATSKDRFSGKRGTNPDGTKTTVGNPASQLVSFAPAIEYNFSDNFGMIGGVWFSLAGKNTPQFASGTLSVVISY